MDPEPAVNYCYSMGTFGENIRRIRKDQGLSQRFVAQKAGMDQSTLSKIERGEIDPTLENALNIAKALSTDIGILVDRPSISPTPQNIIDYQPTDLAALIGRLYESLPDDHWLRKTIDDLVMRGSKAKLNSSEESEPPESA